RSATAETRARSWSGGPARWSGWSTRAAAPRPSRARSPTCSRSWGSESSLHAQDAVDGAAADRVIAGPGPGVDLLALLATLVGRGQGPVDRREEFSPTDLDQERLQPRVGGLVAAASGQLQPLAEDLGVAGPGQRKCGVELG